MLPLRTNRISKGFRGQFFAPPASTFHPLPPTQSGGAVHMHGPFREVPMVQRCFVEVPLLRPVRNFAVLTVFLSAAIAAFLP